MVEGLGQLCDQAERGDVAAKQVLALLDDRLERVRALRSRIQLPGN
jgi:hypothetical protein